MNRAFILDVMNELLVRERHSVAIRLEEANLFVSRLALDEAALVRRIAAQSREHGAWLAERILALGGTPDPGGCDVRSADLHFESLCHMIPRLVRDCEELVRVYTMALPRVESNPETAELLTHLLQHHRQQLGELQQFAETKSSPAHS